ncbi:MAG: DUF3343 domain-containing protein [Defluviitaleaceae bacterium]|nr:DUF3343 domain-containing protein [Defluviitaleaceae bacterium]
MDYYVITFKSMNDALKAEKLMMGHGGTIIPVPTEISADCGFALRISSLEFVESNVFEFSETYEVSGKGKNKVVKKKDY